jgi:hypothetical protein
MRWPGEAGSLCPAIGSYSRAWNGFKQNLADIVQEAHDLHVFVSNQGMTYPPPVGVVDKIRWMGAGWPDYPWLFATDGEYTAFAAVAAGQFNAVKNHLRALRDISEIANDHSGKVVHEVTPDGQVYFGANADPGSTDETVKFASAVALVWRWTGDNAFRDNLYDFAVRNMKYALALDTDGDGWPEGSGNVERPGMGLEKLDVAVYTIRGLLDLADMAAAKGDKGTARWAASGPGGTAGTPTPTPTRWPTPATSSCTSGTGSARRRWRPSFRRCGAHRAEARWHRFRTPPSA